MKKIIQMLLIAAPLTAHAFNNEPNGFRGYTWGDTLDSHKEELSLTAEGKDNSYFSRNGDNLKIGGAELNSITYHFSKYGFTSVTIKTEGIANNTALISAFQEQFGKGFQSNRYIERYLWTGSNSIIFIDCSSVTRKCSAFIHSSNIKKQIDADKKSQAMDAAKDF